MLKEIADNPGLDLTACAGEMELTWKRVVGSRPDTYRFRTLWHRPHIRGGGSAQKSLHVNIHTREIKTTTTYKTSTVVTIILRK